jgi:geranylgeranyl diphosphate synthase type II
MTSLSKPAPLIADYFKQRSSEVDRWLDRLLPAETEPPPEIHRAMRYSIFAGGKRLRPILTIATGESLSADEQALLPAACAVEMIHTYSLIHDDLPAMDNDDLRRGRPTCHRVFGEAMAILAGDALLTQAFRTLSRIETLPAETQLRLIAEIAEASGTVRALIGGQVLDLQSEGKEIDGASLEQIHRAKTGALIRCAVRLGAITGGAESPDLELLTEYGEKAGLAFQIADDILDEVSTSQQLGKTAGKDAAQKKATYAALYGIDAARERAGALAEEAIEAARRVRGDTSVLQDIARFIVERES